MNIQWSKLPHLHKVAFETYIFLLRFCLFWKGKSLYLLNNYFKLICLWKSRPNSFMEGDEGGMFSKSPDWKPLFLLKTKIKQNPGCPNKEYNAIFKHIHENSRTCYRSKKICSNQWLGKYFVLGRTWGKQGIGEQVLFVPNTVGCLGGVTAIGKIYNFYPHLNLEPVFAILKLTRNYDAIYEYFFSWKLAI